MINQILFWRSQPCIVKEGITVYSSYSLELPKYSTNTKECYHFNNYYRLMPSNNT
jgi:hypothetical protein